MACLDNKITVAEVIIRADGSVWLGDHLAIDSGAGVMQEEPQTDGWVQVETAVIASK